MSFHVPEKYRIDGTPGEPLGAFTMRTRQGNVLHIIASNEYYWEHVSVSLPHRTPTWEEMCLVKEKFWDPDDCVVQFHPPESRYINVHPHCLHLWRPTEMSIVLPPPWLVG